LTDGQITNDKFLVYINDLLSSGWIPELFAKDELDEKIGKIRNEAKSAGYQDVPDELFDFFLDKVRKNLHLALCFSPVGDAFRSELECSQELSIVLQLIGSMSGHLRPS